ncbi:TadE family protein [Lysobacter korlensis]|uniref:TadE family protein n=1 Tax=Lysobacter korlensis TaxID=553636 RepID=A0ABV6RVY1_9GAMM
MILRRPALLGEETGSAPAEFVLVAGLLTLVTLSVMQLGLVLHVRNTALDAASEGARFAALADAGLERGRSRTEELLTTALGPGYAGGVSAAYGDAAGQAIVVVSVRVPLPLIGMAGLPEGLEVTGRAALEAPAAAPTAG